MSSEFLNRLNSRLASHGADPSPNRIQQLQKQEHNINILEDLLPSLPDEVASMLETSNGKLKRNRIAKLQESVNSLSHEFKLNDFLEINGSCLDKSGAIDEKIFREIILAKKSR